jgi:hypothetical protein
MKTFATSIFLLLVVAGTRPTDAADCMSAANEVARKTGGEVLNVVSSGDGGNATCEITLRIPGKNGKPPRVVTRTIKD